MEVILSFISTRRFVNRGFLIGPYCPIYGVGVLFIIILAGCNTQNLLVVFLKSILICSILEYSTSYFMEKLFKIRWWDYSNSFGNINGRICLTTMIPFGLLGTFVIYYLQPFFVSRINNLNNTLIIIISVILMLIFLLDIIVSNHVLVKIKDKIKIKSREDNTDTVRYQVENWLKKQNSALYHRFLNAFPKFKVYVQKIKKINSGK